MKKIRIVFQGDSITDAGRDKRNYYDLGEGYAKYAAEYITEQNPDIQFEFINQGIAGNRTSELFDRFYRDAIAFDPDIISILIGINDLFFRYHPNKKILTSDEQIELNYRSILKRIRNESKAKIIIMSPFLLDNEPYIGMREDLARLLPIIRRLADEFADVFIPLDKHLEEVLKTQPEPHYFSKDGVHPNENARPIIGRIYAEAINTLIREET